MLDSSGGSFSIAAMSPASSAPGWRITESGTDLCPRATHTNSWQQPNLKPIVAQATVVVLISNV